MLLLSPPQHSTPAVPHPRDRNTKDGWKGYVLPFQVDEGYLGRYVAQTVGASVHQEYWIPADELEEFNRHLAGPIEVIAVYNPADARF